MEETNKSKFLVVLFWIATAGCFIFGYYNTHLGLRTFNAFGSGYGSWFLAAIPLVMVVGGYMASVLGQKKMLALYLTGEIIFFVFNLTYLYPTYLGRTLVQEEAKALKDSVNSYNSTILMLTGLDDQKYTTTVDELRQHQEMLLWEIRYRDGFGPRAKQQLKQFNELAGTHFTPEEKLGNTQEEREELYARWKPLTDDAIEKFIIRINVDERYMDELVKITKEMKTITPIYCAKLDNILDDNSDVSIDHEAVKNNSQILFLKEVTTKLDEIAQKVNAIKEPDLFNLIVTGKETIAFPKTQKLGTFEHTMISTRERLNKLDTWGVLIICFFFDLLGPFLFYFYLRKDEDDMYYSGGNNDIDWDAPWYKRLFGLR